MYFKSFDSRHIIWACLPPLKRIRMRQLHRLMAGMLKKSYPLPEILESLAEGFPCFAKSLKKTSRHTHEGMLLSEAMKTSRLPAPLLVDTMIETGENHNILPETLDLACELDNPLEFKEETVRASQFISYLTAVGLSVFVILISIFVFIVPVFQEMYAAAEGKLPEITVFVINSSNWIKSHLFLVIVFSSISLAALIRFPHWVRRHERICRIIEAIPVIGVVFRYARWWRALYGTGALTRAGIKIDDSLKAMGKGLDMPVLLIAGQRISSRLDRGFEPAEALKDEKIFPKRLGWALSIAADNSDVADTLENIGRIYREIAVNKMNRITSFAYVMLTMILILIVGIIVFSMYLPLFTLGKLFI